MSTKAPVQKRRKRRRKKQFNLFVRGQYFDFPMLFIIIFLVCFGLIMIYSSSSYRANIDLGDPAYYLKRQMMWAVVGFLAMLIVSVVHYKVYMKFTVFAYIVSIFLQILVLILPNSSHGAKRWIDLGFIQFQPSEVSKVALILFLAHILTLTIKQVRTLSGLIKVGAFAIPLFGLVGAENLSTALVILGITMVMLFVASPKYSPFIVMIGTGVVLGGIVLIAAPYRMERIAIWLDPANHEKGMQTMQALYAIGSGGFFGKGLGQSMQKMGFIPESHNDMIFSIICEELGLFGAVCIIIMFMMLLWRIMCIANNAPDLYSALICSGVMAQVGIQVFINIAVVTNTIPPTGIPLPFISYGGTSLLFLMVEMGMVLGISRHMRVRK